MFKFEKISERDIDLILMRCFGTCDAFADLFLRSTGWPDARVVGIEHSFTDPELGESDITVTVEFNEKRYALLIENKIDATAMPEQCHRYHERGKRGIENCEYADYALFIIAPESYLRTNDEAKKYPNRISYETMLTFFEENRFAYECEALRCAIRKKESHYTVQAVPSITQFWEDFYAYTKNSLYSCEMYPPLSPKGSRSIWPQFRVPLRGTALFFKSSNGFVDLEFSGKLSESFRLKTKINPYKDDDMHWYDTGKSLSLRVNVDPMDFRNSFAQYEQEVEKTLSAVERLTALATKLNDEGFIV